MTINCPININGIQGVYPLDLLTEGEKYFVVIPFKDSKGEYPKVPIDESQLVKPHDGFLSYGCKDFVLHVHR